LQEWRRKQTTAKIISKAEPGGNLCDPCNLHARQQPSWALGLICEDLVPTKKKKT
jgi:hypothetical protein